MPREAGQYQHRQPGSSNTRLEIGKKIRISWTSSRQTAQRAFGSLPLRSPTAIQQGYSVRCIARHRRVSDDVRAVRDCPSPPATIEEWKIQRESALQDLSRDYDGRVRIHGTPREARDLHV